MVGIWAKKEGIGFLPPVVGVKAGRFVGRQGSFSVCVCGGRRGGVRVGRTTRGRRAVVVATSSSALSGDRTDFKDVDNRVVKAVERLGERRITVADVAAAAGVGINETEQELLLLAQLTGGKLEVSNSGDIVYSFARGVRTQLQRSSLLASIREQFRKAWPVLFYLIRVSFGAFLFISILTVFTAISVLSASSDRDDRGGDRRGYGSMGGGFRGGGMRFFGPDIFDIFYWSNFRSRYYGAPVAMPQKMGFLESVFSFVFGDGDPNRGIEERRWKAVAGAIRANDGAVTAEQLAPFLDPPDSFSPASQGSRSSNDESFVVPALLRFQGHPEVTQDGEIVYIFPEMTKSGTNVDMVGDTRGRFIEEDKWQFSKAGSEQKVFAGFLGGVNFFGVVVLSGLLSSPASLQGAPPTFLAGIQGFFPFLAGYAVSFAAIPIIRMFLNRRRNLAVDRGNEFRQRAASLLVNPPEELRRKERAARQYALDRTVVREQDISFSTDRDSAVIDEEGLEDFDKKLRS